MLTMLRKIVLGLGYVSICSKTSVSFAFSVVSTSRSRFGQRHHSRTSKCSFAQTQSTPPFIGHGRGSLHTLFMGWGPDPIWGDVTVLTNEVASKSCVSVSIKVNSETVEGYTVPGQYCQVKFSTSEDEKPLFLAVASPPSLNDSKDTDTDTDDEEDEFEFLIKKTDNNSWITEAKPGTVLQCSQVMGGGFPIKEHFDGFAYDFPTQNILMFAAGSGIAPIRSAIESGMLNISPPGKGGRTARLYYGVRSMEDMPYKDLFGRWEMAGVEVVPVLSDPSDEYQGRSGYVQNALEEDGVSIPRNSGALMCGMKGMAEGVKDILSQAGVFEGRILTNF